ncbi:MAG: UDP-N-acetylglucosamine 1-carboxyvinyltransferase [Paenibacillaceae bacterium]
MEKLVIEGGKPLSGTIRIHGAKNAALPILAACIMAEGVNIIDNVPKLLDIEVMLRILAALGCRAEHHEDRVTLDSTDVRSSHIPKELMTLMRSSIFLMGPLLARTGEVQVYQPGGCAIGTRRIDLHLKGLEALGASIEEREGLIICRAERLIGTEIMLDFPSVGATENIMMAATTAEGTTFIHNAAREPEIVDLQNMLNRMGANIKGAGTDKIEVIGVNRLTACHYRIIPDRIVAGTLMVAAAATRGHIIIRDVNPAHLTAIIHVLRRAGVRITIDGDIISVSCMERPKALDRIVTAPYPAFPTDLQAQIMVFLALSDGMSIIKETIFEGRFKHIGELSRMGADITQDLNCAFIRGVPRLYGNTVEATDLRAGAAIVIAGLAASGTTIIEQVHHIDRGYEQIDHILSHLGANIHRHSPTAILKSATI